MSSTVLPILRGRGTSWNPPNRFERLHIDRDGWSDPDDPPPETVLLDDTSRTILAHNSSPDVGFDVGINPYRGCSHGCSYCYARPSHEYLGFSAGLDFETKILVKRKAPELLRAALSSKRWRPRVIGLSGNTDAYQPAERRLRITRRCLEVLAEFRNPVVIVTKSYLVSRDVDLLSELAQHRAVNVAPIVPGLTDHEMPEILQAAADAGASFAGYIMLRLPHGVKDIFSDWLSQHFPDRRDKVLNRVRDLRGGRLYDSRFEVRGRGEGPWADQVRTLFGITRRRLGMHQRPVLSALAFRSPVRDSGPQIDLFL